MIGLDHSTLKVIILYGAAIALLTLAIPISVQSLIAVVSFGTLMQPILVISLVLFIILAVMAGLRVAQAMVIETLQQGVFAQIAFRIVSQLPKACSDHLEYEKQRPLMNFFFETETVQKMLATLLLIGVDIILVSLFSMILIAFYHPFLLIFDIVLISTMSIAIVWPWKKALYYAHEQCSYKHDVAYFLQDLLRNVLFYKFLKNSEHLMARSDHKVVKYLAARQSHFRQMLKHIVSINVIAVLANVAMLLIGGYLVIKEQLTIGQLVASELVVSGLLYGFVRLSGYLQGLYELLASSRKLYSLLTLQQEACWESLSLNRDTVLSHAKAYPETISVINLPYMVNKSGAQQEVSFNLRPGSPLALYHHDGIEKSKLVEQILRLRSLAGGQVMVNQVPLQDTALSLLRDQTVFLRKPLLITGTVFDNLTLGCQDLTIDALSESLRAFGLEDVMEALEHGLDTPVSSLSHPFTVAELCMINWLHAFLKKPKFWVLDGFLDLLRQQERAAVVDALKHSGALVLVTTGSESLLEMFDQKVVL